MINIAIIDDHKIFTDGVKAILNNESDLNVSWSAKNSIEASEKLAESKVDVILMDISLGEESGIDLTKKFMDQDPSLKILALSMHYEDSFIVKILELGAKGYLLKDAGGDEMISAIQTVHSGNTYYSNHVSQVLIKHISKGTSPNKNKLEIPLTKREIEILVLIAKEYSNPEIAKELFISVRTVDTHRRNLLEKLGAKNTAGLVKFAIKFGLIELS
jgi:DNA-binding NarL/FixJ family response regulator